MQQSKLEIQSDGKVFLNLPEARCNKRRFIGTIDFNKKEYISVPRYKRIHLFRATNSLSVPYDLVYKERKKKFIYVKVILDGKDLWTSTIAIKKLGEVLCFSKQGFEPQVFLKLSKWKKTKKDARAERTKLMKANHN
jgi:hypothetical protein